LDCKKITKLKKLSIEIRKETLKEIASIGKGHVGGSMSIADLLSVLYGEILRYDTKNPNWNLRDYLVVSKGHAGPAVYAVLAIKGFFPKRMVEHTK